MWPVSNLEILVLVAISLVVIFGSIELGQMMQRHLQGKGERLRQLRRELEASGMRTRWGVGVLVAWRPSIEFRLRLAVGPPPQGHRDEPQDLEVAPGPHRRLMWWAA